MHLILAPKVHLLFHSLEFTTIDKKKSYSFIALQMLMKNTVSEIQFKINYISCLYYKLIIFEGKYDMAITSTFYHLMDCTCNGDEENENPSKPCAS
jgi:hypothetical protein